MINHALKSGLAGLSLLVAGHVGAAQPETYVPYAPEDWPEPVMDSQIYTFALIDRLEAGFSDEEGTLTWDAQGWIGGDYNKLWIKTEGEGEQGETLQEAEVQFLYSRLFTPFWNWQAGVRYDVRPNPDRAFAVLGIQGLAPYWFETDTAFFVSDEGDVSFRGEFEYELLFTQRLILQPRLEINIAAQDVPEYGIGSGVNNTEMGLRLRYEIHQKFAPYIGVSWTRMYGETADLAREEGESTSVTSAIAGVRAWF